MTDRPTHQEAAARLGRMAFDDGDLTTAASLLERATAPASVWLDLGVARQDLRDYAAAAAAYRKGACAQARLCRGRAQPRHRAAGRRRRGCGDARLAFARTSSAGSQWR